jgi:hypothetical protein
VNEVATPIGTAMGVRAIERCTLMEPRATHRVFVDDAHRPKKFPRLVRPGAERGTRASRWYAFKNEDDRAPIDDAVNRQFKAATAISHDDVAMVTE